MRIPTLLHLFSAFITASVVSAAPAPPAPTASSILEEARAAIAAYDFNKAEERLNAFSRLKNKGDVAIAAQAQEYREQLARIERAIENVSRLRIIERYDVDAEDFYRHIKLPPSAGRLLAPDSIPFAKGREEATLAFSNEAGDYMMWCQSLEDGSYGAVESSRLTDGSWQEPHPLPSLLAPDGEMDFPVMRSDGVTLYFAASGENSLGGMDLYVASRDPQTGEYLQPRNLGMPFNSPADDLMVAVDEENGVGWLVTDREQIPDKLTIYLYLLEEPRVNLDADSEDILAHARISKVNFLDAADPLRAEKLESVNHQNVGDSGKEARDVLLTLPGGKRIHTPQELSNARARTAAGRYTAALQALREDEERLRSLRKEYAEAKRKGKGNTSATASLTNRITQLEAAVEGRRAELKGLRNAVAAAETGTQTH